MMQAASIALLFILSLFTEASLISSLGAPLSAAPVLFFVGVVVMHRSSPSYGAAWFALSALLLPRVSQDAGVWVAYLAVGVAGTLLMSRVFTNRSVYALLGLGATLYVIFAAIRFFLGAEIGRLLYGFIFAMMGIYAGSAVARFVERYIKQLFIIRQ